MIEFLLPYLRFIYGGAFALLQVLDGLGHSPDHPRWISTQDKMVTFLPDPVEASAILFFEILLIFIFLMILLMAASYTIGRRRGAALFFLFLLAPGLLNLIGWWPKINYQPEEYVIGGNGSLGVVRGMVPLLLMFFLIGWSVTVILYDNFKLNEKFRNSYDHLWYFSALMAGAFFVTDNGASLHWQQLKDENARSQKASSYLLAQVRQYDKYCADAMKTEMLSCRWASEIQQRLNEYMNYNEELFHSLGPLSSREVYGGITRFSDEDIFTIRREISIYNTATCPYTRYKWGVKNSRPSGKCQSAPSGLCSNPEPPLEVGEEDATSRTVALASECIVGTLVASRFSQQKFLNQVTEDRRNRCWRWIYFILFAAIVGGKVANVTTKLAEIDNRMPEERIRIICLSTNVFKKAKRAFRLSIRYRNILKFMTRKSRAQR